jgi:hypothetical protein
MIDPTVRSEVSQHANDILVACDLMDDSIRDADKHTAGEAVLLRHAAMTLAKKVKEFAAALELHLVDVLEEPIDFAGWQFRKGVTKKQERFDHDEIGTQVWKNVTATALARDDPQWEAVGRGAKEAVRIMRDIYLSESDKAKVGRLDYYGIPRDPRRDDSVRTYRKGVPCIEINPIQSQVQE